MNSNPFLALADRQRKEITTADLRNLQRVIDAYGGMYNRLEGDIDALITKLESGELTPKEVRNSRQFKRLVRNATSELDKFTAYLEVETGAIGLASVLYGTTHSAQLVNALIGGGFEGLDPNVIAPLLEYLKADGPLYARLKLLTGSTVDYVVQTIIEGVTVKGYNPRRIAAQVQDAFGRGLTDALRNTRTVQIYSYRDAARANYVSTGGMVDGWIWYAELDDRVCLSCVAMHGTIHPLDEQLNDHYNGRCAPLPHIAEFGNPVQESGEQWFNAQPESTQRQMMGAAKYEAWKDNQFDFNKLSTEQHNDVYGNMRTEASLKQLIGAQ